MARKFITKGKGPGRKVIPLKEGRPVSRGPKAQSIESELAGFTGTENYYRNWTGLTYTDGIRCMAGQYKAYWLIDLVGSYRDIAARPFMVWTVDVKGGKAVVTALEDTGMKPAVTQKIPYTDFPEGRFEFYTENGVMLLKSEH